MTEARDTPRFWFAYEVPWAKLATARVLLFGLLALDALLQIRHAPRYGTGFNVAQIRVLDHLAPTRVTFGSCELVLAWLFVMAAFGVATRVVVPIAAAIYAWLYFGSQLDSYQHHYLVALVLAIASFVPWRRPAGVPVTASVRSWAVRLILVQLAFLYVWAAISKLDVLWLDGTTLASQLGSSPDSLLTRAIVATVGWRVAAISVVVVELTLAATVWNRRAGWIAAPLGIAFHLGIAMTNLEIGLFAWLMIAAYALVLPDAIYVEATRHEPALSPARPATRAAQGVAIVALIAALALGVACRFELARVIAGLLAVVAIALVATSPRAQLVRLALAHLCAMLLWLGVDRLSTVTTDYYRLWGGSARRLDDLADAERAYARLVELEPDSGDARFKHGRVLLELGRDDDGRDELRAARDREPDDPRAWLEEARWLAQHGRRAEALVVARDALASHPNSSEARALVDSLTR